MMDFVGELLGTFILVLLGNGVVAGNVLKGTKGENTGWIMITLGWGLAVTLGVLVSGFYSPAHLNPAVSIAFAVLGQVSWGTAFMYIIAQMIGAMLAQVVVWLQYLPHWDMTPDPETKLAAFSTGPAVRDTTSNFIGEVVGTAVLVIGVMAMGPNNLSSGFGPFVVGAIVASIGLSLGGTTGYAINPARDLGPRIVYQFLPMKNKGNADWGYAWIPVLGPIVGGIVGGLIYNLVLAGI